MKKAIAILLTLSMLLALTACGGSSTTASGGTEPAQSVAESAEAEAEPAQTGAEPAETEAEPAASGSVEPDAETAQTAAASEAIADTSGDLSAEAALAATEADAATDTAAQASTEAAAQAAADLSALAGSYKLTAHAGELGDNLKIVSTIVDLGANFYLSLKEDGTGSMNFLEAQIPLEWDGSSITIPSENGENLPEPISIPFTFADDLLKMSTSEYSLDFSRLTEEEQAKFDKDGAGGLNFQISKMAEKLTEGMEGGLVEGLLTDLALGLLGAAHQEKPIPEGEPSEGTVTGTVSGMEFTVLGAEQVQKDDKPLIVFYYEVTNNTDTPQASWSFDFDASQAGAPLESYWEEPVVPETFNNNYEMAPGRTLRCAEVFTYDPAGGVVGFRISYYEDDSTVLYYADPQNLTGAPAEPFVFDADPSIPAYVEGLPAENEELRVESAEFFKDEDGNDNVRFYFYFKNTSGEDQACNLNHSCFAVQDGFGMRLHLIDESVEEEKNYTVDVKPGEEIRCARSFMLRTGSPVAFIISEDGEDFTTYTDEIAWITEVE